MSRGLALCADVSMLTMGGELKRKEMISARLGDVLSHLYMASAVLKRFEDDGRQVADLPFVHYCLAYHLHAIGVAFAGFFQNFPKPWLGGVLKRVVFPFGIHYQKPNDIYAQAIAEAMMEPGVTRDRHTFLSYWRDDAEDVTGHMELAFLKLHGLQGLYKKLKKAQKAGELSDNVSGDALVDAALAANIIDAEEAQELREAETLRMRAIAVDSFAADDMLQGEFTARPV